MKAEDPLDISDIEIAAAMHARAGRLALNTRMSNKRAAQLLAALLKDGEHLLTIKFLREWGEGDWVVEDKFDPVQGERKRGQAITEISRG